MKPRGHGRSSLAGQLLLANPGLRDPNFRRAVVLLSAHDREGAIGVVLNRPLNRALASLNADAALSPLADVPLYQGGPVEPEKLLLVAWRYHDEASEFQLHFGLEPDKALELVEQPGVTLRGFLGYAGWGRGQLDQEMTQNTWFTAPVGHYNLGAADGIGLWRLVLGSLDPELKLLADEPEDPALN